MIPSIAPTLIVYCKTFSNSTLMENVVKLVEVAQLKHYFSIQLALMERKVYSLKNHSRRFNVHSFEFQDSQFKCMNNCTFFINEFYYAVEFPRN